MSALKALPERPPAGTSSLRHRLAGFLATLAFAAPGETNAQAPEVRAESTPRSPVAAESQAGALDAYRLTRQGRLALQRRVPASLVESVVLFEQALEADPDYAPAWAGLAESLSTQLAYALIDDAPSRNRAEQAIERTLALDPELAEAWVARGLLAYLDRRSPEALAAYRRAIDVRPDYAQAQSLHAFQSALQGNTEQGVESARQAVRLNPQAAEAWANLSAGMLTRGRWEEAQAAAERVIALAPGWSNAGFTLGMVYFYRGDYARAAEQLDGVSVAWTGAGAEMLRARALVRLGREEEAREALSQLESKGDDYAMAALMAELGDQDAAYARLMAVDTWDDWATLAIRNLDRPLWAPDGEEDRYEEVLARVDASWGIERR